MDSVPERVFEVVGILVGLATCLVILFQFIKELRDPSPSSMGVTYVIGWLFIFIFWFMYGVRFHAMAIILTNSVATVLQMGLLAVVFHKRKKAEV